MNPKIPEMHSDAAAMRAIAAVVVAAMLSLAVAMGVGRFAFTPLFPLMVRDGLLGNESGAWLAAANYLGYLAGALLAARVRLRAASLLALGLVGTVLVTGAIGWTSSLPAWALWRFVAGVLSAWSLVATSAWALGWLATHGRPQLAGVVFAGVGLGIAFAGVYCALAARPDVSAQHMWIELAALAAVAIVLPLVVSRRHSAPAAPVQSGATGNTNRPPRAGTGGIIFAYTLFGFGYILPATYLPAQARQLIDDPQVFGWAWPVFGAAAAVSTLIAAWGLRRFDRRNVWAASHLVMAVGVLLPAVWPSLVSILVAALCVGGTFMVITMVAMQEARARAEHDATAVLARMTAGFAFGQLMGPVVSAALARVTPDFSTALNLALLAAACGLVGSAFYLRREVRQHRLDASCHA
ncbi:MAG: YbfB/YjiJ family MFS transporter [Aromatoleum sp.]|jgi:MFS family permease|uniref:YbfB/YjiJ family MFS transporter n=1 Tax=Aromatoleum sp. TaxID=2307007 RepID=UPI0028948AF0|nr:YbfB/YjiJ family MFS transporter [Aromatoleum sp.]MDT3669777.1 YbfB/YjiJ family MFS transporter [Aromatoleum sp.]